MLMSSLELSHNYMFLSSASNSFSINLQDLTFCKARVWVDEPVNFTKSAQEEQFSINISTTR